MSKENGKLKFEELSYKIRGAFFEVYNTLGPGFKEQIYHNALAKEFRNRGIPFNEKERVPILYKEEKVGVYEPDFVVDKKILVELKSVPQMPKLFETQLFYYLNGTPYEVGFLVNFGGEKIEIKRRIQSKSAVIRSKSAAIRAYSHYE